MNIDNSHPFYMFVEQWRIITMNGFLGNVININLHKYLKLDKRLQIPSAPFPKQKVGTVSSHHASILCCPSFIKLCPCIAYKWKERNSQMYCCWYHLLWGKVSPWGDLSWRIWSYCYYHCDWRVWGHHHQALPQWTQKCLPHHQCCWPWLLSCWTWSWTQLWTQLSQAWCWSCSFSSWKFHSLQWTKVWGTCWEEMP